MFILLDFDVVGKTLTVIDTTDNIVETLPSDYVFRAVEKGKISVFGIERLKDGQWQVYRVSIPSPSTFDLPNRHTIVHKLHIHKQKGKCWLVAHLQDIDIEDGFKKGAVYKREFNMYDGLPVEMKNWYLVLNSKIWLDDEILEESFIINGSNGGYAFSGRVPYGVPITDRKNAMSFGDFVTGLVIKGISNFTSNEVKSRSEWG